VRGYEVSGPLRKARRREAISFEDVLNLYRMNIDRLDILRHSRAAFAPSSPSVLSSYDFSGIVIAPGHDPQDLRLVQGCVFQEVKLVVHIHADLKLGRS
jgi:hypothetical protein